jgi:glucuronate isomerase
MMKKFLDDDFLLDSKTAVDLYETFARRQPIIDYHCHLSPHQVADDYKWRSITEIWLQGDHYKWRAMRTSGVPERNITGRTWS